MLIPNPCQCFHNQETGYFEPCCEMHEQDYIEYLHKQRNVDEVVTLAPRSEVSAEPAKEPQR